MNQFAYYFQITYICSLAYQRTVKSEDAYFIDIGLKLVYFYVDAGFQEKIFGGVVPLIELTPILILFRLFFKDIERYSCMFFDGIDLINPKSYLKPSRGESGKIADSFEVDSNFLIGNNHQFLIFNIINNNKAKR